MAIAIRAMEICSPVERSMSISRAGGCSVISRASSTRSSVVSPRALTTTSTWFPACLARMALRAAAVMRSALATLLPPNFSTPRATGQSPVLCSLSFPQIIGAPWLTYQTHPPAWVLQTHQSAPPEFGGTDPLSPRTRGGRGEKSKLVVGFTPLTPTPLPPSTEYGGRGAHVLDCQNWEKHP